MSFYPERRANKVKQTCYTRSSVKLINTTIDSSARVSKTAGAYMYVHTYMYDPCSTMIGIRGNTRIYCTAVHVNEYLKHLLYTKYQRVYRQTFSTSERPRAAQLTFTWYFMLFTGVYLITVF